MALIRDLFNLPTLIGTAADDLFDVIGASMGKTLIGGLGNDVYLVDGQQPFAIVENAGEGTDTVIIDGVAVSAFPYQLAANVENLVVRVSGDGSTYQGNGLANAITMADSAGTGTDNFLDGGLGNDTLAGGFGDDTYYVDAAGDVVVENAGAGNDTIVSTAATYTMGANVEALVLGGTGNINGVGNALDNVLTGNSANNSIDGGAGNDTLDGGTGNDTLVGNTGDDSLIGGAGPDNLQGGAGNDTYYVVDAANAITEAVAAGNDRVILADSVTAYALPANVEDVYLQDQHHLGVTAKAVTGNALDNLMMGSELADTIDGGAGNDVIYGQGGADILKGGAGNDSFVLSDEAARVVENAGEGTDTVYAGFDYALGANVENLVLTGGDSLEGWGNGLANVLTGNAGSNLLLGGDGNDTIDGGAGGDMMYGGQGDDTYYVDNPGDLIYERYGQGTDTVITSGSIGALYVNVEKVVMAGTADLYVYGNDQPNAITGNAGNNTLAGGGGADSLAGGLGNDTYYIDAQDSVTEAAGAGVDTVVLYGYTSGTVPNYTLAANVENLRIEAGEGGKNVKGNLLDNVIYGAAGADIIDGDAGHDSLAGGAGNDTLAGGAGNDVLNGQAGADLMKGGAGDDTYYVTSMTDRVDESTVSGGGGADTVISNLRVTNLNDHAIFSASGGLTGTDVIENITLDFSAVDAVGNALGNVIRGNNSANVLAGGAGNDTYYADLLDTVDESTFNFGGSTSADAGGTDTVVLDVGANNAGGAVIPIDMATRYAFVENLTLLGTGNYGIIGTNGANVLTGNDGRNTLRGLGGNDTMAGGKGDDSYQVDAVGDKVVENAGEGNDTVFSQIAYTLGANLENLVITGAGTLAGTGNTLNNRLEGGAGNNSLQGLDGNDSLFGYSGADTLAGGAGDDSLDGGGQNDSLDGGTGNDTLAGGAGIDTLAGGAGDDLYIVDASGEVVTEAAGAGNDTLATSADYALAAAQSIETLQVLGAAGRTLTGNASDNTLVGGVGNDTLAGGGGNDVFDGSQGGSDKMTGGAGNDTFKFLAGSLDGGDNVDGGSGGTDVLAVDGFDSVVAAPTVTGIEVFNIHGTGSTFDFAHVTTAPGALVNLSGGDLVVGNLGSGTSTVPRLALSDFTGNFNPGLAVATGSSDTLTVDLARVDAALVIDGIETLKLNVVGTPLGDNNFVALNATGGTPAGGTPGTAVELSGTGRLMLGVLAGDQVMTLNGYSGLAQLALADASGLADSLHVNVIDSQAAIQTLGIETLEIDSGNGTPRSGIQLNLSDAATVVALGQSDLSIRSMQAANFDAHDFQGDNLRVVTLNGTGTAFDLSADTHVTAIGAGGDDSFTFNKVDGVATLDNYDQVNGNDGDDTVTADIDGLVANSTGALRLANIEYVHLINNTAGVQGGGVGAGIDGANMGYYPTGYGVVLTGSAGIGKIDADTIDELKTGGARTGQFDTLFYNLGRDLDATGYSGDIFLLSANTGGGHTYRLGEGNHNLYGSSQKGVHDVFDFGATTFDSKDFVEGFDTGTDPRLGTLGVYGNDGDTLDATLDGLNADLALHTGSGALRMHGVETATFTLNGSNTVDATDMDGVYTINLQEGTGASTFTLANLDAVGTEVKGGTLSSAVAMNITGGAGNDTLVGGAGEDTLVGGAGADRLDGGAGADSLAGGAGNDQLKGGAGNDTLNGGAGFDTADYSDAVGPVTITIGDGAAPANDDASGGVDTLTGIEKLVGGADADQLSVLFADDTFKANWKGYSNQGNGAVLPVGDQSYVLVGGLGNDVLTGDSHNGVFVQVDYSDAGGPVHADLGAAASGTLPDGTPFSLAGSIGYDVATDTSDTLTANTIDGLRGSAYNDILIGGGASKNLVGTLFESFVGGAGNDFIAGSPTAAAGGITANDFDRADYASDPSRIIANLGAGTVRDGWGGIDTLRDINLIRGSAFADQIYGSDTSGSIQDFQAFEGMAGDDVIDGQGGMDRADYRFSPGAVNVNLATGIAQDGWGTVDSLANIEWVMGSDFADTLTGGAGNDWLSGMAGNDVLDGGLGTDRADYRNEFDANHDNYGVVVNLGTAAYVTTADINGKASGTSVAVNTAIDGWGNVDTLLNMENVRGTVYKDIIIGSAGNNVIDGQAGNDTIDGGLGTDLVDYSSGTAAVTVNLAGGTATDGLGGTDQLAGIEGAIGSQNNDTMTGDANANIFYGGLGNDNLTGGAGNDIFVFNTTPNGVSNVDAIADFATGSDKLQFDNGVFTAIGADGAFTAANFVSGAGAVALDAADRLIYDTASGDLYYDADGNAAGSAAVKVATLSFGVGTATLAATDIQII